MTLSANARLQDVVQGIKGRIDRFKDRPLGEQNTKASLIEPIIEALGWDIRDPDEVHREFKPTSRDKPVDYALKILRKPRLFIEAKGLGESLADRKWIVQILSYATVAGVEWCVLTDGNEYRFYNATAPVDAEEKLFCSVRLTDSAENDLRATLDLISRSNMEGNTISELWSLHFVDRRIKEVIRQMLGETDRGLIRLIRRQLPKHSPREIAESLRRLDIRIELPVYLEPKQHPVARKPKSAKQKSAGRKAAETRKILGQVALADLIAAGHLIAPVRLFRHYKGHDLEAHLQADGTVEFQGKPYDSCSTAAEIARGTITGRRMNTNGWAFWQYLDREGQRRTLDSLRMAFLKRKQG